VKAIRLKAHRKPYSKGRWQVEKERFHLDSYQPAQGVEDAAGIGDVVAGIMKSLGLEGMHWLNILEEEWTRLVGDAVAKHSRPGRMEKKTLTVFVDNSVWLNELLRYGRKQMLENLQKRFGKEKIGSIRLVLDPDERPGKALQNSP
jgi:hypothetical protein